MSDDDYTDLDWYQSVRVRPVARTRPDIASAAPIAAVHQRSLPPQPEGPVAPVQREGRRRRPPRRTPQDVEELHGLEEGQLSDPVRKVLLRLIEEAGELHDALDQAEERIGFLETVLGQDHLGPWLNMPAFAGRLTQLLALEAREGAGSTLAVVRLENAQDIRRRYGLTVHHAALAEIGFALVQVAPDGSLVGRLGDGLFGVMLTGVSGEDAETFADAIGKAMHALELELPDRAVPLPAVVAVHPLGEGPAEAAIEAAERSLDERER